MTAGDVADGVEGEGLGFGTAVTAGVLLVGFGFGDMAFVIGGFGCTESVPTSIGIGAGIYASRSGNSVVVVFVCRRFPADRGSPLLCIGLGG